MNESETMVKYISHIREMAERLTSISALIQEIDIIMTLLGGLSEGYSGLIIALGVNTTELTLENVCSHLLNEEIRKEGSSKPISRETVLFANKKFEKF